MAGLYLADTLFQQEVWTSGSADTVCPRPPLMTHSILFPKLRRGRDETYRQCELYDIDLRIKNGHKAIVE